MRVFITGSGGFVGRWLAQELTRAGHEPVGDRRGGGEHVDVRDAAGMTSAVQAAEPDGIVHLAAVAAATEARANPETAFEVAIGGTVSLLEAARTLRRQPSVVVVGSSEVYGYPHADELPLAESAPLRPRTPYALSKMAQESVALAYAARLNLPLAVVRAFNHIGPGQRPAFVVPAIAARVLDVRDGRAADVPVGNLDVRRDFTDVRDVVRAYRLLLEAVAAGAAGRGGRVFNVGSGRSVSIRQLVELLSAEAGIEPNIRIDPELVRSDDPADIRADTSALRELTGWQPTVPLARTLADVWRDIEARATVVSS